MNDLDYRLAQEHMTDMARASASVGARPDTAAGRRGSSARGSAAGHVHPLVRPLWGPTAHPAPEAWPGDQFARLQQRIGTATTVPRGSQRRSVVVLPSRSVDRWHESAPETRSYEERLLSFLFELRDPRLELTYITSLPVAPGTIDYYISLLPPGARLSARKRLRLVSLGDGTQRPLSEKLLERPRVLEQIRRTLTDPRAAYLLPYNSTDLEREIALALDIPVYGADPDHAWLGTKSGGRALFDRAGVPHPLGAENIRSIADAVGAIRALRAAKPELAEVVIKLDNAVSGEGNALIDLTAIPAHGIPEEDAMIEQRLAGLVPEVDGVTAAAFLRKLATQGGVVEERITGRELRSPSVQLQITPTGAVELLSTHDQILHGRSGQQFAGCRFPADPSYAPTISVLARRAAERLADTGVIGRLAIDFLASRREDGGWEPFALEVNLRMGGTTHSYQTLAGLTGGRYDPRTARFTTPTGQSRDYVATDHLEIPPLRELGHAGLLARAAQELRFDHKRAQGTVFHMLSSVEPFATVGVTAIAEDPESADALHEHIRAVLARGRRRRVFRRLTAPARIAIDMTG
jgi:hypothetical protein